MKNLFILTVIIFNGIFVYSQITIDQIDLAQVNDFFATGNPDETTVDYVLSGEDFMWDFSELLTDTINIDTFYSPSSINVAYGYVFSNTMALKGTDPPGGIPNLEITDLYDFFENTSSSYSKVGIGAKVNAMPIPMKYDSLELMYSFPLNYGNIDSSNSSFGIPVPTFGYYGQNIKRINTVDGWGTITTPYGTFEALRIKVDLFITDTIYYEAYSFGTTFDRSQTEYHWLGKEQGIPLLKIIETGAQTTIIFKDSLPIDNSIIESFNDNPFNVDIFPNPANDVVNINLELKCKANIKLQIINNKGELVYIKNNTFYNTGKNLISLNLKELHISSGVYYMSIYINEHEYTKKLIVL